jgi:hypothetical protein
MGRRSGQRSSGGYIRTTHPSGGATAYFFGDPYLYALTFEDPVVYSENILKSHSDIIDLYLSIEDISLGRTSTVVLGRQLDQNLFSCALNSFVILK